MKNETDFGCSVCKNGICMRIMGSRLEDFLGHRLYQCDHCGQQFKFKDDEELWTIKTLRVLGH